MRVLLIILGAIVVLAACSRVDKRGKELNTPTSGAVKIAVDGSLKPLLDAEIDAFEKTYKEADIEECYISENAAIDALLQDSVQLIVITRKLTAEELHILESQKYTAQELTVAYEGVALLLHRENPDSLMQQNHLKEILRGNINQWRQMHPHSRLGNVALIFNEPNSGIVRFLHDSVASFTSLPPYCFAVNGDSAVIDYVSKNKNAIGLIGVSWISDKDDPVTIGFLKTIRVAALSHQNSFYQPYQAYIAEKNYPLIRELVMISREARAGLASGFMTYVASEKGQRIILKAGLVPATMPVRTVEFNQEPLQ